MSQYYNAKRTVGLFDPESKEPHRLSRTKLDLFLNCPRCFYLDCRLGTSQPPGYPFALNNAVDLLLKKEFDIHRANNEPHPLMKSYGLDLVPFHHEKMEEWRDARRRGIRYHHEKTNFIITGGIDDLWVDQKGEISVVDYKATAQSREITLDDEWKISYKRQMEIYQWLFRRNGFKVSDTGYFVYCNAGLDKEAFDGKLEFNIKILPYKGSDKWVEDAVIAARKCLMSDTAPLFTDGCDFCEYTRAANQASKRAS